MKQVVIIIVICVCCILLSLSAAGAGFFFTQKESTEYTQPKSLSTAVSPTTTTTRTPSISTTVAPSTTAAPKWSQNQLSDWFKSAGCNNMNTIKNYGSDGWWHSQSEEVVKNDMKAWSQFPKNTWQNTACFT